MRRKPKKNLKGSQGAMKMKTSGGPWRPSLAGQGSTTSAGASTGYF